MTDTELLDYFEKHVTGLVDESASSYVSYINRIIKDFGPTSVMRVALFPDSVIPQIDSANQLPDKTKGNLKSAIAKLRETLRNGLQ